MTAARFRAGEAGITIVELVVAMALMLVITSATLGIFTALERGARDNQRLNDEQRAARVATDVLAKRLRNIASPTSKPVVPQPLERAEATDLVFRTVNSVGPATTNNPENLERYRYCLGANRVLYAERQTWTGTDPGLPATTGCGAGDGWPGTRTAVAQSVVNGARPVFKYQVSPTPGTYLEQSSVSASSFPNDIAVRVELFVDPDTANAPKESTLTTRVFLRNQNRPPTAAITPSYSGPSVTLNASDSSDPEKNPLSFQWSDNGGTPTAASQLATYSFTAAAGSTHVITLRVFDVGGLQATATLTVNCTASPITCSTG